MVKRITRPDERIQTNIDGENSARANRRIVAMGGSAVRPVLEAMVGGQGRVRGAIENLVDAHERIANKRRPLADQGAKEPPHTQYRRVGDRARSGEARPCSLSLLGKGTKKQEWDNYLIGCGTAALAAVLPR